MQGMKIPCIYHNIYVAANGVMRFATQHISQFIAEVQTYLRFILSFSIVCHQNLR